jgi:hypothetical protein
LDSLKSSKEDSESESLEIDAVSADTPTLIENIESIKKSDDKLYRSSEEDTDLTTTVVTNDEPEENKKIPSIVSNATITESLDDEDENYPRDNNSNSTENTIPFGQNEILVQTFKDNENYNRFKELLEIQEERYRKYMQEKVNEVREHYVEYTEELKQQLKERHRQILVEALEREQETKRQALLNQYRELSSKYEEILQQRTDEFHDWYLQANKKEHNERMKILASMEDVFQNFWDIFSRYEAESQRSLKICAAILQLELSMENRKPIDGDLEKIKSVAKGIDLLETVLQSIPPTAAKKGMLTIEKLDENLAEVAKLGRAASIGQSQTGVTEKVFELLSGINKSNKKSDLGQY